MSIATSDRSTEFKFCKVADFRDWQDPTFQATAEMLGLFHANRKAWEFIQVYCGLERLGLLNGESRAIGLGVGNECLIYAFTNVCQNVVATDLYNSQNWSTAAMATDEIFDRNPFPYQRDRLQVKHMDMTAIEFADASFDFVWSCCAIEHVTSFEDLHRVYAEIHRVLKPGGIAALTTEFNVTEQHSYQPHMLFTDNLWIEKWFTGEHPLVQGFEIIDRLDLSLSDAPENQPVPRVEERARIQVITNDVILNSVAFFLRKQGEFSQAYTDQWLPEDWRIYLEACTAKELDRIDAAQATFRSLLATDSLDPRLKLGSLRHLSQSLLKQGNTAAVVELCRDLQTQPYCITSENGDHLVPLAVTCKQANLLTECQWLCQKIQQLPGCHIVQVIRSYLWEAECYGKAGDNQKALHLTETALDRIQRYPTDDDHKVYFYLGFYKERLGRLAEAIDHYQAAIDRAKLGTPFFDNCHLRYNACRDRLHRLQLEQTSTSYSLWAKVKKIIKKVLLRPIES